MGLGEVGVEGGGCRDDHVFEKHVFTQLTPQHPGNHSTHRKEITKEEGAYNR